MLPFVILSGASAYAQPSGVLEEIIVTAQKRDQNLQDVGISISAFSADQLRDAGITSTDELDRMAPNVLIRNGAAGPTITEFSIRGVSQNDFGDHNEAPVAVYVDGAYVSYYGGLSFGMFDIERVEILRGPQGTVFGRNATGGLVHLISQKPTDEFEAFVDLTLADYDQVRVEAAIGGPLTDTLSARVAILSDEHDGYIDNRIGPDTNEQDATAYRAQLLFKPSDAVDFLLNVHGYDDDKVAAGGYTHEVVDEDTGRPIGPDEINPFCVNNFGYSAGPGNDCGFYREPDNDPFSGSYDGPLLFDRSLFGTTGTLNWDLSDTITLTSITDYLKIEKRYLEDSDGSPNPIFNSDSDQDADQVSQEIRLNGEMDNSRWLAGFYYLNIDGDYEQGGETPDFFGSHMNWSLETTTWSVFGQMEYDFTPELTLIAGLRWTEDDKDASQTLTCSYVCGPEPLVVPLDDLDQSDGDYSYKLQLEWHPADDTMLYAGVTRGNKAGGFSFAPFVSINTFQGVPAYDPEVLTSYEAGFKTTFGDGLYRLNGSLFYYDYEDYQAFSLPAPFTQLIVNVDATVVGAELEFVATPWEGWEFQLGMGWLDAEAEDVPTGPGTVDDQEMPQSPSFSANGLIRKSWLMSSGTLSAQVDANYVGERQQAVLNSFGGTLEDYVLTNARIGWASPDDKWDVSAFVKNVFDEEFYPVTFGTGNGAVIRVYNPPRWAGLQARYRW